MPDLQRMSSLGHFGTPNHYYSQIGGVENEYHQPYSLMNFRRDSFILAHGPNESTFSHDGRIANSSEAERFFNGGLDASGVSNFSNDSRLSFGFARGHHRVPLTPGENELNLERNMTFDDLDPCRTSNGQYVRDLVSLQDRISLCLDP